MQVATSTSPVSLVPTSVEAAGVCQLPVQQTLHPFCLHVPFHWALRVPEARSQGRLATARPRPPRGLNLNCGAQEQGPIRPPLFSFPPQMPVCIFCAQRSVKKQEQTVSKAPASMERRPS